MNETPVRFSVVLTAYNEEKNMETAIESILHQTYGNFELILIDDGSDDRTGAVAEHYSALHRDIRVIRHGENLGRTASRNEGLREAQGDYLLLLDAGDVYEPDLLKRLADSLERNRADVVVFSYSEQLVTRKGQVVASSIHTVPNTAADSAEEVRDTVQKMTRDGMYLHIWNKCYSLETIRRYGLRFPEVREIEGALFDIAFFDHASSAVFLSDILYRCRECADGPSADDYDPEYLPLRIKRVLALKDQFERFGILDRTGLTLLSAQYFHSLAAGLYKALRHGVPGDRCREALQEEFHSGLYLALYRYFVPAGKGDRYLRLPLARGEDARAVRREKRMVRLGKFFPDLYARYIM